MLVKHRQKCQSYFASDLFKKAIALITELVAQMDERYRLFEAARCSDLDAYNQSSRQQRSRIICIFNEYADFLNEILLSESTLNNLQFRH